MNKVDGYRTILSVTFSRTEMASRIEPLYIHYKMERLTPFGTLSASARVLYTVFNHDGAAHTDGEMLRHLSEVIHREETQALMEVAANVDFGDAVSKENSG